MYVVDKYVTNNKKGKTIKWRYSFLGTFSGKN